MVRGRFESVPSGEHIHVVSDPDPTPAGEFMVDLLDATGPPEEVLDEFSVQRRGPNEWVLVAGRP